MRSSSRSPGLLGLNRALQHLSTPDALACIQGCPGPIIPVHDLQVCLEATLNYEDSAHDTPAQPAADLHLQVFPQRTLEPGIPFRQTLWRFSLTVLGKQSSTSPNVMLMDSSKHQRLLLLAGPVRTSCMLQCLMPSQLTTSSTVASMFRETFQLRKHMLRCHPVPASFFAFSFEKHWRQRASH